MTIMSLIEIIKLIIKNYRTTGINYHQIPLLSFELRTKALTDSFHLVKIS